MRMIERASYAYVVVEQRHHLIYTYLPEALLHTCSHAEVTCRTVLQTIAISTTAPQAQYHLLQRETIKQTMPVSQIHYLLRNDCYFEVVNLLEHDPNQARTLNSARATPLAVLIKSMTQGTVWTALDQRIPQYVNGVQDAFDALLTAHPLGVENVDKRGHTALIIACSNISGYSGSTEQSTARKILAWAVDRMIDACPSAASIADGMGRLPLAHVCDRGFGPLDILTKLARAYPEALLIDNTHNPHILNAMLDIDFLWDRVGPFLEICPRAALVGHMRNPIQTLWSRIQFTYTDKVRVPSRSGPFHVTKQEISDIAQRMNTPYTSQTTDEDNSEASYYSRAKTVLLLLLKAAYYETTADDFIFRPVHAAAGLCIPAAVLRLVAKMFPDDLTQIDDNGWLPLHVAAAGPYHSRGFDEIDTPTGVEILVKKYPAAARMIDVNGKLPLHLALEAGKTWRLGIRALVSSAPLTLRVVNGQNGLYPFEDAAASTRIPRGMDSLDTVFSLLRADPTVLSLARHR